MNQFHPDFVSTISQLAMMNQVMGDPAGITEENWAGWSSAEIVEKQLSLKHNKLTPFEADLPFRLAAGLREYGKSFAPVLRDRQLVAYVLEYDRKQWWDYRKKRGRL